LPPATARDRIRPLGELSVASMLAFDYKVRTFQRKPTHYLLLATFFFIAFLPCARAQVHSVLCSDGDGTFQATLFTKVDVHVGATKKGPLAVRSCEAILSWENQKLVVASDLPALDLDAFGVDLGLGSPVAAFQLKTAKTDCCMTYKIYSLQKPPKLISTLTGGSFFAAADTDLDGRVEVWTDDAAAVNGIDNLTLAELDFAPPVVLRFDKAKLLDVSAEFADDFDKRIKKVRSELNSKDVQDFKSSDGRLRSSDPSQSDQIHHLRGIKIKILEIVWCYLYSGRDAEAWHSLDEMWPTADVSRIRELLTRAQATGIRTQVDGALAGTPDKKLAEKKTVKVYEPTTTIAQVSQGSNPWQTSEVNYDQVSESIMPPLPIMMRSFLHTNGADSGQPQSELTVSLVIDSAGKVRSVVPVGNTPLNNINLLDALSEWKFVPAYKGHHPVASDSMKILSFQQ